jgi:hypothetical protein
VCEDGLFILVFVVHHAHGERWRELKCITELCKTSIFRDLENSEVQILYLSKLRLEDYSTVGFNNVLTDNLLPTVHGSLLPPPLD